MKIFYRFLLSFIGVAIALFFYHFSTNVFDLILGNISATIIASIAIIFCGLDLV